MITNEKELILDIKEMLETYNNDMQFTNAELDILVNELYGDIEDAIYQISSDIVIDYSNNHLRG
jgi:hypothetical protein